MIQIFIDGKQIELPGNTNIKLTTENPYFTKSVSYTYEIEVPLTIPANRAIFGPLHRIDISKEGKLYEASIVVDNVTVLTGTAHITSVTESGIKVQLLGEAASYNYGNKMEETYIDQLDLGDWFWTTWPDGSISPSIRPEGAPEWFYAVPGTRITGTCAQVFDRVAHIGWGNQLTAPQVVDKLFSGEYPWVAYPTLNTTADTVCNKYSYRIADWEAQTLEIFLRDHDGIVGSTNTPPVESRVVQPYVWIMAEKIAQATGFTLPKADNALLQDPFLSRIFIVNTNNSIQCAAALPHWTVNEWWTQIEDSFGLVLTVDYQARQFRLRRRETHYAAGVATIEIDRVVDQYTAELDDESHPDISANNVGFADHEAGPEDILSDDLLSAATFNDDFSTLYSLSAWLSTQDNMYPYKNVIFRTADGRQYIYSHIHQRIEEVNMLRPRIVRTDNTDLDVELKFVPARFIDAYCDIYGHRLGGIDEQANEHIADLPIERVKVRILAAPGPDDMVWYGDDPYNAVILDIDAIINADEEAETSTSEDSSEDVIYIAVDMPDHKDTYPTTIHYVWASASGESEHFDYDGVLTYPRPYLRQRQLAVPGLGWTQDQEFGLSLIPIAGESNLAAVTVTGSIRINATVRHCIKFIADRIPDTGAIFLIHNKRFVCERIEANIRPEGLDHLLTGYFYEIEI